MSGSVTIRTLSTIEDYQKAEAVQRDIWQMRDLTQVIPLHVLLTAQKNGGLVAGAFDPNGNIVGILFGFIGLTKHGKFKHCSHIMGVLPQVRRQNVGRALKLFQREYVLAQGLDLITWTYDPLEGVNASLNIASLGAIVRTYHHNLYGGSMTDGLNSGLPTDRFEVEWWIASPHVQTFTSGERHRPDCKSLLDQGAQLINRVELESSGALNPVESRMGLTVDTLLLEVPPEFQAIKTLSMELAREWRSHTAQLFTHYFERGYAVTDFISERSDQRRHNYYVLTNNQQYNDALS
jgi:predicted GNAT superfamily acetyltransferase